MKNYFKRLILFLIRRNFGVREYEEFQFTNQKSNRRYFFTENGIERYDPDTHTTMLSNVKLNWILDKECEIRKTESENT